MAVRTQENLPWGGESFQVDLVAYSVAGPGEADAVLGGEGLEELVVVSVLEALLENVMVHVFFETVPQVSQVPLHT